MSLWPGFTCHVSKDVFTFVPSNRGESTRPMQKLIVDRRANALRLESVVPGEEILNHEKKFIVHGILGIISLHTTDFLIVITNRKKVANIVGANVYLATDFRMLPVKSDADPTLLRHPIEKGLLALIKESLYSGPLYFSYEFDLTSNLQRQVKLGAGKDTAAIPLWRRADTRFFWNYGLQKRFIEFTEINPAEDLSAFIMPVLFGFLEVKLATITGRSFLLGLIARRSRFRAGTRYFSRGIDTEGHVSNFNETEQFILLDPPKKPEPQDMEEVEGKLRMSFVQTRGSVPVFWGEVNNLRYKPDLVIEDSHLTMPAIEKHMSEQVAIYGKNYLVNLVNQKGYEKPVKEAYERAVSQLGNPLVQYDYFDFHHECKGMRFDRVSILLEQLQREGLSSTDYFSLDLNSVPRLQLQKSVVRTNCMDCLDRTNVVQSAIARWVLNAQLHSAGILAPSDSIDNYPQFLHFYRNVWADHADVVSKAYSGTGALKTDYTRTGKRSIEGALQDGINSLTRYVKNNFFDGKRQDAYDLITGAWDPQFEMPFPDTRSWSVQLMPWLFFLSLFFFTSFFFLDPEPVRAHKLEVGPVSAFPIIWGCTALFSLIFIWQHGVEYVCWPSLRRPVRLIDFVGPGYYSGLHGRKGTPADPARLAKARAAQKKMQ
ncbi:Phosphoinositide phosphatase sac1 [Malassezia vespertilionis]|uniref:Phosphoinositide phosphatase sac1 n=1 Tax=Malassezia vespertilionis TaxID=2020962 RepID=UPI0024B1B50C|nr:Phosphoinositide phosphatase sac1 [Malassezia vespertilionis]WFD05287.1 Phosphoinositide phosphatase sac1 [Malassezia vespertilionis]